MRQRAARARAVLATYGPSTFVTVPVSVVALVAGLDGSSRSPTRPDDGIIASYLAGAIQWLIDHAPVIGSLDLAYPERRWAVALLLTVAAVTGVWSFVRVAGAPSVILRTGTLLVAQVALWSLVLVVPTIVTTEVTGRWASIALAGLAAALTVKLVLLFRASTSFAFTPPEPVVLLSNQQRVLEALLPRTEEDPDRARRFELKQLTGEWGTGKSYVVHALKRELHLAPHEWRGRGRRTDRTAVVCVDIWKHDTEVDLHRAIVGEILGHPACQLPLGWLRFPVLGTIAAYVRNFVVTLNLGNAGSVEVPVVLPRLSWQRPLERTVARLGRRRIHLLVVLDELDRASAVVAQAALSMVHRSLDLPGVTVVLVHVPDIVEAKAFNPMFAVIPDLRSNATAQVLRVTEARSAAGDQSAAARWEEIRDALTQTAEVASDATGPTVLDLAAARAFAALDLPVRRQIVGDLSEKFLRPVPVQVGPLDPGDVAAMLDWRGIRESIDATDVRHGTQWNQVLAFVAATVAAWQADPLIPAAPGQRVVGVAPIPPIRRLKSAMEELIGAASCPDMQALDLALCVIMALETCRLERGGTAVAP